MSLWTSAHMRPSWIVTPPKGIRITPTDNNEKLREMWVDPLVLKKNRIDSVYGVVSIMEEADANIARLPKKVPTLLLYAGDEEATWTLTPVADLDRRFYAFAIDRAGLVAPRRRAAGGEVEAHVHPPAVGVNALPVEGEEPEAVRGAAAAEPVDPEVQGDRAGAGDRPVVGDGELAYGVDHVRGGGAPVDERVAAGGPVAGETAFEEQGVAGVVHEAHRVEVVEVHHDRVDVAVVDGGQLERGFGEGGHQSSGSRVGSVLRPRRRSSITRSPATAR